ncbi:putative HTH-type transcriptional regulator YcgK [Insulibacter thermoxylanivorax]|uniref:HTH-type transcriptional regulator YcgK n=1 Tax=Insulibacter thermoxylanivorax TaxID=2749268 RepID=A0A916VE75_9BACL|nr:LysR family transcriptional regulator [Insulibacter thermoxylanivorax]GFR36937.1 putative HTH-type transcriptional regulator YcgK [Insulibacter thermoxylanivorax]
MELRQLQYAVQLAIDKNFSRAAEKLHIAQPSLSQQIAKLEKELGLLLFQRNTNSVDLTYAGSIFTERAQQILDMVAQLRSEMDDISQMRKGRLMIGSLPITGAHIWPHVLPVFQQKYPEIEIVLVEEHSSVLEQLTANGQTDISLLTLPLQERSLDHIPLIDEEIYLAVPPKHPLVDKKDGVSLPQLADEPFILLKKGQGFRHTSIQLCEDAGFAPRIVFESSNIETVQSLVAAGMGIAFVPQMVARAGWSQHTPVYLRIREPYTPFRTIVIAHKRDRYMTKAADAFIQTMLEAMSNVPDIKQAGEH